MQLRFAAFKGEVPRISPRLLAQEFATRAINTRLEDGNLRPIRRTEAEFTFADPVVSFYRHGSTWLGWETIVNAAPGPVAADRLYYTGDGAPKMRDGGTGTVYPLALHRPEHAPDLVLSGPADPEIAETILYTYTLVTSFGEESRPAPASELVEWSPGIDVTVSGFSAAPAGRAITSIRLYRSQTSSTGITDFYFVAEFPADTVSYVHDIEADPLAEVLPSADYDTPPDGMQGLTSMPNGMMAAFDGREVLFAEPWRPHAWPIKYRLTVAYPVVGLVAFGSTLAILTTGTPYIAQGTHPDSMLMEQMEANLPCLSRRGIVDAGYAAIFPTHEGLAMVSTEQASLISRGLFSRDVWSAMSPATFVAEQYDGRYHFTHTNNIIDPYDCGAAEQDFTGAIIVDCGTVGDDIADAVIRDCGHYDSAFGEQMLGIIDTTGEQAFFIRSTEAVPKSMHYDLITGGLYLLSGDAEVLRWDAPGAPAATQIWRSKHVHLASPTNFGAILIETEQPMSAGMSMRCHIYANDRLVKTITAANVPKPLPAGFLAAKWYIEIEGNVTITAISIAHTFEELAQV